MLVAVAPPATVPFRQRAQEALLPGGGDAVVVTWVGRVVRVASFPTEVPDCPTDPAMNADRPPRPRPLNDRCQSARGRP